MQCDDQNRDQAVDKDPFASLSRLLVACAVLCVAVFASPNLLMYVIGVGLALLIAFGHKLRRDR